MAQRFTKDSDKTGARSIPHAHGGNGTISVKHFSFNDAARPARFVTFEIPPGASEGSHTHNLGDEIEGAFDEFYYVVKGSGQMTIDDEIVPVEEGDHVFTPLGVEHDIENTGPTPLKILLTYVER